MSYTDGACDEVNRKNNEFNSLLAVMVEYERRGSAEMRRVLEPLRKQLKSPTGRHALGIVVDDRFAGPD